MNRQQRRLNKKQPIRRVAKGVLENVHPSQRKVQPKVTGPRIVTTSPFFRPGTQTDMRDQLFKLNNGGMGDFICWLSALLFVAKNYDFVRGHVIAHDWFVPIVENVMKPYPNWKAYPEIPEEFMEGYALKQALIHPVNATMMHLIDLGFLYYVGINPVPPADAVYPKLDLSEVQLPEDFNADRYIVMTPGATAPSRKMPAKHFNKIKDHIISLGMVPVFLGTSSMDKGKRKIMIDEEYDFSGGINLLNKTDLLTAAKIMESAECVVGIDNGLLHLAAMTDVPIVFGYTIVGPIHRRPIRLVNKLVEVYCEPQELACTFCQERVRFFYDHDFEKCIYDDYKCVDMLNAETFSNAIDVCLEFSKEGGNVSDT